MQRHVFAALVLGAIGIVSAKADPLSLQPDRYSQATIRPSTQAMSAPVPRDMTLSNL